MKPEIKRVLAREWLILMGLIVISFFTIDAKISEEFNKILSEKRKSVDAEIASPYQRLVLVMPGEKAPSISHEEYLRLKGIRDHNLELNFEKNRLSLLNTQKEEYWATRLNCLPWAGVAYFGLWVVRATAGAVGMLFGRREERGEEK